MDVGIEHRGIHALSLLLALIVLAASASDALSQDFRVDQVQFMNAVGTSSDGTFSVFSSMGTAEPTGATAGGEFSLSSGTQALLVTVASTSAITHVPSAAVETGSDLVVTCDVDIPGRIRDVEVYYRAGGDIEYVIMEMADTDSDGRYVATIPGSAVTSEGVAYYFVARNSAGKSYRSPSSGIYAVTVHVSEPGLTSAEPLPGGAEETGYRLVSVPLSLESGAAESVLEDDLGPYDPEEWRFFELVFDQSLREYPGTLPLAPGKAFWLIAREEGVVFDTGPGTSLPIDRRRPVALNSGWNLVGNPFNFALPVENVSLSGGGAVQIRSYEGHWNDPLNEPVTELRPFSGYAVHNPEASIDTLYFDPVPVDTNAGKQGGQRRSPSLALAIQISAFSGDARDVGNVAALSGASESGWDALDFAEPPSVGNFVSVYFPHPEWGRSGANYSTDVRAAQSELETWSFEVVASTDLPIDIRFGGIQEMAPTMEAYLVDEVLGTTQDLRSRSTYRLAPARDVPRRLQLVVGSGEALDAKMSEWIELPTRLEFSHVFPNPFNNVTTLSYGLPEPAHVTIEVYDVAGRRVANLEDSFRSEGYHSLVWDGSSGNGTLLPSGLYVLSLRAGATSLSRRATILR